MVPPDILPGRTNFDFRMGSLRPILGEVNDLKRIRVAGQLGSLAEQGFARSWAALIDGEAASRVALRETAFALASARLGGINAVVLGAAGLKQLEVETIIRAAIADVSEPMGRDWSAVFEPVIPELSRLMPPGLANPEFPEFVRLLQAQPRAGATRPGFPRLVLEPPENHAEHCYITGVYAVLAASVMGADNGIAFLAGLSHHFHNVYLPDSGFAGEELLGNHLQPIMDRFSERVIEQLPPGLVAAVTAARDVLPSANSAEGRAFHAGDVWDRVLQMEQYSRVAAFETRQALVDLDLVHPGPLQAFHQDVLAAVGLWV